MKQQPVLILASASPRRRQLLKQAGISFTVKVSKYHEGVPQGDPAAFVRMAAMAKAREVARRTGDPALVLGADTLVVLGRRIFGKPKSRQDAGRMLRAMSGREHRVITGVCLWDSRTGKHRTWLETTKVHMRAISEKELQMYLKTGEWSDKAGAYGIQGAAGVFVDNISGCYYNIVGLPLAGVTVALRKAGILPWSV